MLLSGAESTGRSSRSIAMADVVRAALTQIEDDLVHVLVVPGFIARRRLAGSAADEVVHLLAELIAHAVAVASPVARVQVTGQEVGDRYVLEVQDRGVGPSSDEPSTHSPPLLESVPHRMLVLFEQLARRHGIQVRLCRSSHGGINALAVLPHSLLAAEPVRLVRPDPPAMPSAAATAAGRPPRPAEQRLNGPVQPVDGLLPRRVPMASLHTDLRGQPPAPRPWPSARQPSAPPAPPRSPDQVRSTLASYHDGLRRGRVEAGGAPRRERDRPAPSASGAAAPATAEPAIAQATVPTGEAARPPDPAAARSTRPEASTSHAWSYAGS